MARRFEQQYRIASLDQVLKKENAVHQDLDIRLDALETKSDADHAVADIIARGVAIIDQVIVPQATEVEHLLEGYRVGVPAERVATTPERRFLSDAEIADLRARLKEDDVQAIADEAAAAAAQAAAGAAIAQVLGGAASARNTLKKLSDAIDVLTAGAPALLDSFLEVANKLSNEDDQLATILSALGARLRFDAAQTLSPSQQLQARSNIAAQAALGFTPVQQGTGVGQSGNVVKIGYDSTGLRATIDTTDIGRLWSTVLLTAAALNGIAGQTLYGTSNLSAAQIGAILGYAPARPSESFANGAGNVGDVPVGQGSRGVYATCDFTATAPTFFGTATTSFQNNTSGSGVLTGFLGSDLVDLSTNQVVAGGSEAPVGLSFGAGLVHAASFMPAGGLVVGRNYRHRLYLYKNSTAGVVQAVNVGVQGICF